MKWSLCSFCSVDHVYAALLVDLSKEMPQGSPTLGRSQVDVIRLEPLGKFKQTQNGNVRGQGNSLPSLADRFPNCLNYYVQLTRH